MPFDSGPTTCAKFTEDGSDSVMCPEVGTTHFGTVWVCRRFPSKDNSHTVLGEKDGCLQRCPECLRAESDYKAITMLAEFIDGSRTYAELVSGLAVLDPEAIEVFPPCKLKDDVMGLRKAIDEGKTITLTG